MKTIRRISAMVLSIVSLAVFFYAWVYYPIAQSYTGDFAARLRGGWSFDHTWIYWDGKGIDIYGPIFTLMDYFIDAFQIPRLTFLRILFVFYLILALVTSYLLLRIFRYWEGSWLKKTVGIFLIVNFFPLIQALRQDVIENLQLFAVVLFLYFFSARNTKNDLPAGLSLGLGVSAKTFPIVLFPYLMARRRYQLVASALVLFLAIVAGVAYLKEISLLEGLKGVFLFQDDFESVSFHQNQAISGFAYRLFAVFRYDDLSSLTHPRVEGARYLLFQSAHYFLIFLLVAIVGWQTFPRFWKTFRFNSVELIHLEISILFSAFLLIVPHTQIYYSILILPAYLFLFEYLFQNRGKKRWKSLLILSYLLVGFRLPLKVLDIVLPPLAACPYLQLTNVWNFPFYGLLILLFVLIHCYRQRSSEESGKYLVAP